jgi:glycosyltransferase involved in cell wall biosynthesis
VSECILQRLPYRSVLVENFVHVPDSRLPATLPRSIGFVGRLRPEKRPDMFCELAASCRDAGAEWNVYGDGPLRPALEAKYGGVVHFHGAVNDMGNVYERTGLLVMPSSFEGLPLAALEALAAGIPVLATAVGALPEVVVEGKTGWLFQPGEIEKAARAIERWADLSEQEQSTMRLNCRQHAAQRYSEGAQIQKLMDLYEKIVELPGARTVTVESST